MTRLTAPEAAPASVFLLAAGIASRRGYQSQIVVTRHVPTTLQTNAELKQAKPTSQKYINMTTESMLPALFPKKYVVMNAATIASPTLHALATPNP